MGHGGGTATQGYDGIDDLYSVSVVCWQMVCLPMSMAGLHSRADGHGGIRLA